MQEHTLAGERILQISPYFGQAGQIARNHHENWDGSGYPHGLRGEEIPLEARIVHIVDVFDALTHARVYKPAWEKSRAIEELRKNRGTMFDPKVVDVFLSMDDKVLSDALGTALQPAAAQAMQTAAIETNQPRRYNLLMTRVFLIRHGATVLSKEDRFAGSTDVALSDEGWMQVRKLGVRLATEKISAVYCSDMHRAIHTAEAIAAPHGLTPIQRPGLREIGHGHWEGMIHAGCRAAIC